MKNYSKNNRYFLSLSLYFLQETGNAPLRASHDFDEYWSFHEVCEYKRNHQDLYAGGAVPQTSKAHTPSNHEHLKVIK
jgi:hypothetical protein